MKIQLAKALTRMELEDNSIVRAAYKNLIKNYKSTIIFLESTK